MECFNCGRTAKIMYDSMIRGDGRWAYMCQACFRIYGIKSGATKFIDGNKEQFKLDESDPKVIALRSIGLSDEEVKGLL